jgi:glycosyltransferase involved in cell wall biosynthesis
VTRLRILHTESSLGWGGQEIRILTEAAGFQSRGHDVTLACPREARIFGEAERFGVRAVAAPIARKRARGVGALRRLVTEHRPHVINTHSSTDSWLAAIARLTLPGAPPIVRTRHVSAPVPRNAASRWLYLKATAHIVTTGEVIKHQLVRANGFPPSRITPIPTGIDVAQYAPGDRGEARSRVGLPADVPLVGIVATLRSWKGHRFLLEAFARLPVRDALLVVVGDGPQRAALEAQAAALGIAGRTRFTGNQADVVPWLRSFDVFALPSYANEGVPQALLQAMAVGLPCVTTDAGAIPEIAVDGETALVVPREDAPALAGALQRLLDDPDLGARLATAARRLVAARHSVDEMLDRMEEVFRIVVAAHRRQRR